MVLFTPKIMSSSEYDSMDDSDVELQNAFAKGIIKTGLNVPVFGEKKKDYINDVASLKQKLLDIHNHLKWVERLDLSCKPAPLAPEMAIQFEEEQSKIPSNRNIPMNEFKRETDFHRQAQAAVLEGLARLKNLGIQTKRPEDYFAEMAKSDSHMQKVRSMLVKKQAEAEQTEKIRKIRQQRKLNKQIQKEGKVKKQNEKKEMLDEVKKFRKGIRKDLDFLDNKPQKQTANKSKNQLSKSQMKRKHKDSKFGFGGKKRGLKANTKESSANLDDNRPSYKKNLKKSGKKGTKQLRPGKSKRIKSKARKN